MRYRLIATLIAALALLWLLDRTLGLDPLRTGAGALLLYGGYRLLRSGPDVQVLGVLALDLSRAILPPGEQTIRLRALAGDVDILLPFDLPVSVTASVAAGRQQIMGTDQSGLIRRGQFTSPGYAEAVSKVKIEIALGAGEIDVRCL